MEEGQGKRSAESLKSSREINRAISERLGEGKTLRISGIRGQERIGACIGKPGNLIVEGELGDYGMAMNRSLHVTVRGSAGRFLCWRGYGGEVVVEGDAGDEAALGMEGGRLLIKGDVRGSLASAIREGVVVVMGSVEGDVAVGGSGGLVVVAGSVRGEISPRGTRVLLEPSKVPILKRGEMKKLTPQELKEIRELLGEWVPPGLENYLTVRLSRGKGNGAWEWWAAPGGPPPEPSTLKRLLLTLNPFSQVGPSTQIYLKSRFGEGENPVILKEPFFIPHHILSSLSEHARRAVVAFSLKSEVPLIIDQRNMEKEFLDVLESINYFTVFSPASPLPRGEVLENSLGVVVDLASRLQGNSMPFRELKEPRDLLKLVKLFKEDMGQNVILLFPSGGAMRLTGLGILSGADASLLLSSQAPYGTPGGFRRASHASGDLQSLSEAHLALEEIGSKGKRSAFLLDGGVIDAEEVLKALSMGARAVSLAPLLLKWLGCRWCQMCDPLSCPVAILKDSGEPTLSWDEMAESMLGEYNKLIEELKGLLRRMGLKGIQELSRKNLLALDRDTAYITSLPLAGLGRRVQG